MAARIASFHRPVLGAGAQGRAQVGHVFLAEAHVKLAGAGQPDAVAAFAEVVGERRDEADLLARLLQPDIARGAAACARPGRSGCSAWQAAARRSFSDQYWSSRSSLPRSPIGMTSMKVRSWPSRAHHSVRREELVLVHALQRDGVDLDVQTRLARGLDAVEHLGQAAPAGDLRRISRHPACRARH